MRHVTVRQLQVFVETAQAPSLARVADKLHITPAAVSFQLKQIESMTGFTLFERIGRKTRLTSAGATLLVYAKTALQALDDADRALTSLRGSTTGKVTLGLVSTAKYFVPHMIAAFNAEYPGIRIHLRDGNRREILAAVTAGEIDLAIAGRPPEDADITAEPFAMHPSVIVAPPGHHLIGKGVLSPLMLAGEPMIMREEGSGTRLLMENFFKDADVPIRQAMTTSSNEMIKQAVMARIGLALISRHTIGLEHALGLLTIVSIEGMPLMRSWYVAGRTARPLLPIQDRLRQFILANGQRVLDQLERSYPGRAGTQLGATRMAE